MSRAKRPSEDLFERPNLAGAELVGALHNHPRLVAVFQHYGVSTCYLFGSRSTGLVATQSDIDLAVLFAGYRPLRHNLDYLIGLENELSALLVPVKVDLIGLQRTEDIALRFEIISTGIVLYCADDDARSDFEELVMRDYQDFKPVSDLYYREMEAAVFGR